MTGLDMNKMRKKFNNLQDDDDNGGNNLWKPEYGEQTIRIMPTEDGDPFKEFHMHYGVGNSLPFACPKKNFNDECPVCEFVDDLYDQGDEDSRDLAGDLKASKRFYSPVLVREEEEEGIRWWSYSPKVQTSIFEDIIFNPDYGDVTDPEDGFDLRLTYKKTDQKIDGRRLPSTSLTPRRLPSPAVDDGNGNLDKEKFDELIKDMADVEDVLIFRDSEEAGEALSEHMNDLEKQQEGEDQKYVDEDENEAEEESGEKSIQEKYQDMINQ